MRKTWLLLALAISVTCLFAKVMADYDHAVNFAQYHTYSWIAINVQEPLWNDRVTNAVDAQLAAQGWSKVASGGDATISVVGSTQTERRSKPGTQADLAEAGIIAVGGSPAALRTARRSSTAPASARCISISSTGKQRRWSGTACAPTP